MDEQKRRAGRFAVRRRGAEALVHLNQRRAWFADEPVDPAQTPTDTPKDKPDDDKGGEAIPDWAKDPAKAYAEIQKLRQGEAAYRTKASDAEKKLAELDKAAKDAEKQKLVDGKDYQKLYEQAEREKAEALQKAQATELAALRLKVGTAAGLPVELSERLVGATAEELAEDAKKLKGLIPAGKNGGTTTGNPSGAPGGMTYEQRKNRLYGGSSSNPFKGS